MERENLIDDDAADKRMKVKTTVLNRHFITRFSTLFRNWGCYVETVFTFYSEQDI